MNKFAIEKEVSGSVEEVCQRVTEAIKPAGFGILTRIDFDKKIKEKLGEVIKPCVILGACNPKLALSAYKQSADVALFVPCNIVLTELAPGKIKVEALRPTQMLNMLSEINLAGQVESAERALEEALEHV
jgi:uncharacterized protein (DUF302 family)